MFTQGVDKILTVDQYKILSFLYSVTRRVCKVII